MTLITFLRDEEPISLNQRRGFESIDANLLFIFVKTNVESVAQEFSNLKQINVWIRDVYNLEISVEKESTFVFQLRGHPWSLIYKPSRASVEIFLLQEDARNISNSLNVPSVYFAISDTSELIEYELFMDNTSVERLYWEEGDTIEFYSQSRQIEAGAIQDAYQFTDDFLRAQDVYVPCLIEDYLRLEEWKNSSGSSGKLGTVASFNNLMPDEVERMDYLAQK